MLNQYRIFEKNNEFVKVCWLFSYVAQDFHYFDEFFLTEN